jgi:hypothetical protein
MQTFAYIFNLLRQKNSRPVGAAINISEGCKRAAISPL